MLENSGLISVLYIMGGLFGMMMSFYLALCFIQWLSDFIEEKQWKYWF